MVGAGIFALPGTLHAQFGTFSPWLFPIFGLLFLLIALPFARLAGLHPRLGRAGRLCRAVRAARLLPGRLALLCRADHRARRQRQCLRDLCRRRSGRRSAAPIGRAATIVALIGCDHRDQHGRRAPRDPAARSADLAEGAAADRAGALGPGLVGGKLAAAGRRRRPFRRSRRPRCIILYAFVGFENSVVPAGETADARRTIPRALIVTLVSTATLYFLVQLAYVAVMPAGAGARTRRWPPSPRC